MGYSVYPAPSAAAKIQKTALITSTQSWTVPADVTQIELLLCGGGSGGNYRPVTGASGALNIGGFGSVDYFPAITVTPGSTHTVTIGAGGGQVDNEDLATVSGGTSSFGALATVVGGTAMGQYNVGYTNDPLANGSPGGRGGSPFYQQVYSNPAQMLQTTAGFNGYGGAGASSPQGINRRPFVGQDGGGRAGFNRYATVSWIMVNGENGKANTGGGGGAGYSGGSGWSNAGNGGSGVAIIKYWSAL